MISHPLPIGTVVIGTATPEEWAKRHPDLQNFFNFSIRHRLVGIIGKIVAVCDQNHKLEEYWYRVYFPSLLTVGEPLLYGKDFAVASPNMEFIKDKKVPTTE